MAGWRGAVTVLEVGSLSMPLVVVTPPPRNEASILAELDAPAAVAGAFELNEEPNSELVEGPPEPNELAAAVEEVPNPPKPANLDTGAASVCRNQSTS